MRLIHVYRIPRFAAAPIERERKISIDN
ncbi:protein of unknown function [Hyphomicrobium sp. MC1]|nr:protein of unknown function [Hyphomicrobium sp. MC1]